MFTTCLCLQYDFTMCSGGLLVLLLVLMAFGFIAIFVHDKVSAAITQPQLPDLELPQC